MRDLSSAFIAILSAFVFYVILSKISISLVHLFNIMTLPVLYFALVKGEVFGACVGMSCGLIQDAFSLGVFGVAGIAKTITGFTAGYFAKKIDVTPFIRNTIFLFVLLTMELSIWLIFYSFIFSKRIPLGNNLLYLQPVCTAVSGGLIFIWMRRIKTRRSISS